MVSTTECLGFGVVNIPSHCTCFTIRRLIHRIPKLVFSVLIRIFASYGLTLIPNLVKPFIGIISHYFCNIIRLNNVDSLVSSVLQGKHLKKPDALSIDIIGSHSQWHYYISYNILAKFLRLPKYLNMGINHRFSYQEVCQSY